MKNRYGAGLAAMGGFLVLVAGIACGSDPGTAAPGAIDTPESQPIATAEPLPTVTPEPPTATVQPPATPVVDPLPTPAPEEIETDPGHVTGTISYLQRIALGPDASVVVKLLDTSRADAPSITLSEQIIDNPGQVPIAFDLPYDLSQIDSRFTYVVRAEIYEAGELVFATTTSYPVITRESPNEIDLQLEQVAGGDDAVIGEVICMTTMAVQGPIEIVNPGDAASTAFDGVNSANCTFPEEIGSVRVTITNIETGATHVQVFSLPESAESVSFPLSEDALSMGTAEIVAPGEYSRVLEAIAVAGTIYDLTADQRALDSLTVLPVETTNPADGDVLCMSTLAVQLPIEIAAAWESASTAFDGINVANCTFPVAIETVRVTITHAVSGATHTQVFSLQDQALTVSFPLADDALSIGTLEVLEPGEYNRVLEAVSEDGVVYDLTATQGALGVITVTTPAS